MKKQSGVEKQDDFYAFNKMGDKLTWTLVQMKGRVGISDSVGSAEIELGDHPIAKQLASIGIEAKSVESKYGINLMANLHAISKTFPV